MSSTIFEKIARKEIPGYIIWEDDQFMAFLDINPVEKGHCLVVPKSNLGDYLFDLSPQIYQKLLAVAQEVAQLLKQKLACERVIMLVEGFEVPHVHIHLIPSFGQGLKNMQSRSSSPDELVHIYELLTTR